MYEPCILKFMRAEPKQSSDFYSRVYSVVAEIPVGRVTTYGTIAAFLGARSSSRLVGYALMAVADDMALPCHRVVNRVGELSGSHHFPMPGLMRELLESEGVEFNGERVVMSRHFWDPENPDAEMETPTKPGRQKKKSEKNPARSRT
ncbi:MAG: ogt 2 [Chlorobi bacterium]|nr:ogt 2 [Chlorobiota bacterium]